MITMFTVLYTAAEVDLPGDAARLQGIAEEAC